MSLVLAPLLAAVGVPVGDDGGTRARHSQGTVDKLAAVPGFRTDWSRDEAIALIDRVGVAMLAQTERIAPADRTLYALRDVTGTVQSLPLIVASIMSKKLAMGAATLVLDVKCGRGAFRQTPAEALELAHALVGLGRAMGVRTEAILTDMNQPLGPALGTACEIREALAVLGGGGSRPLRELTVALARVALTARRPGPATAERDARAGARRRERPGGLGAGRGGRTAAIPTRSGSRARGRPVRSSPLGSASSPASPPPTWAGWRSTSGRVGGPATRRSTTGPASSSMSDRRPGRGGAAARARSSTR